MKMLRLTMRELLLIVALIAVWICWWRDRNQLITDQLQWQNRAEALLNHVETGPPKRKVLWWKDDVVVTP